MNGKRGLVPSNFIEKVPGNCCPELQYSYNANYAIRPSAKNKKTMLLARSPNAGYFVFFDTSAVQLMYEVFTKFSFLCRNWAQGRQRKLKQFKKIIFGWATEICKICIIGYLCGQLKSRNEISLKTTTAHSSKNTNCYQ